MNRFFFISFVKEIKWQRGNGDGGDVVVKMVMIIMVMLLTKLMDIITIS